MFPSSEAGHGRPAKVLLPLRTTFHIRNLFVYAPNFGIIDEPVSYILILAEMP